MLMLSSVLMMVLVSTFIRHDFKLHSISISNNYLEVTLAMIVSKMITDTGPLVSCLTCLTGEATCE